MQNLAPKKYALALHTSSPQLGLCLSNFAQENRCQTWDLERELASYFHPYLLEFLQPQTWQDLEFIAVAKGPGSFTSTRIGVVAARTLGQQLNIPLFTISSLAALAWSEIEKSSLKIPIAIEMKGTRNQLYGGIYQISPDSSNLIAHLSDTLMTQSAWQQTLKDLPTPYHLLSAPINLGNTVTSLLEIAWQDWQQGKRPHWSEALPFYGV
jgi:tRNA threonylcarbamoyl adenosine modification protein YeaZ